MKYKRGYLLFKQRRKSFSKNILSQIRAQKNLEQDEERVRKYI